ncbi:hypothetical protein BT93_L4439 [Corymbia citriodora subsp. variegata]|uniref:Protein kinase domain-containing protein n=1 Tax=Corymbia citriodora subsp. variegata TaxID=360336 RepID=A0A8T0CU31_CORYI|nr:hypothetical protein BT93_L4439 [Corymbia citriodora subsp. variegata]
MHKWLTKRGLHDLHSNMVKCHCHTYLEGYFAHVYDLNPHDTLHNLVTKGLANFLAFLHSFDPPLLVRNLDAAHVMIDQCCHGYMDPNVENHGKWSNRYDVFVYGVVLLCLICKRVYTEDRLGPAPAPCVYKWAKNEYRSKPAKGSRKFISSLVDESLKESLPFKFHNGLKITKLAMQCIKRNPHSRPSMKQVVSVC